MSSSRIENGDNGSNDHGTTDSKNTYTKPVLQKLNTESNEGKPQPSPFEVPPTPGGAQTVGS